VRRNLQFELDRRQLLHWSMYDDLEAYFAALDVLLVISL
jgi:hypothetical protein